MKKLIYIDNDHKSAAESQFRIVQRNLRFRYQFSEEYVAGIEAIYDFVRLSKKEQAAILFNPDHLVCTYSMFTKGHFDSYGQLAEFLITAGKLEVKGVCHIDMSNELFVALRDNLEEVSLEEAELIVTALENNYIFLYDSETHLFFRVRKQHKKAAKKERVNIEEIHQTIELHKQI